MPPEGVELALHDDDPAVPSDGLAREAHAEETPALDGAAKPERVQDRLLPRLGFRHLNPVTPLGIFVQEEKGMCRHVPGQQPVLSQQSGRQARRAELGTDGPRVGPDSDGTPRKHGLRHPARDEVRPAGHGTQMRRQEILFEPPVRTATGGIGVSTSADMANGTPARSASTATASRIAVPCASGEWPCRSSTNPIQVRR
jgi:hypothetical protein